MTWKCPECDVEVETPFCTTCGASQPDVAKCGRCMTAITGKFCGSCGLPYSEAIAAAPQGATVGEVVPQPEQESEMLPPKRARSESLMEEGGKWPTLHAPPDTQKALVENAEGNMVAKENWIPNRISFVATDDGEWCMDVSKTHRMVRNYEYPLIWHKVKDQLDSVQESRTKRNGLLILGHPGVGKSWLLDVLLSWSLKDDPSRPVVVISVERVTVFMLDSSGQQRRMEMPTTLPLCQPQHGEKLRQECGFQDNSTILVLHDVTTADTTCSFGFQDGFVRAFTRKSFATVVIASSPNPRGYAQAAKDFTRTHVYVPVLSYEEVEEFFDHSRGVDGSKGLEPLEVDTCYVRCGGVLRYLDGGPMYLEAVKAQQNVVMTTMKRSNFRFTSGYNSATDNDSPKIFCAVLSPDRVDIAGYTFVSQAAQELWMEIEPKSLVLRLFTDLCELKDDPETRKAALGMAFERWFLNEVTLLPKPPVLAIRQVKTPGSTTPMGPAQPWCPFDTKPDVTRFTGNDATAVKFTQGTNATAFVPYNEQYPFVDAFFVNSSGEVWLVQVTVGSSHKPKLDSAAKILATLKTPANKAPPIKGIVWVVDQWSALNSWQGLLDAPTASNPFYDAIPQYICRVGLTHTYVKRNNVTIPIIGQYTKQADLLKAIQDEVIGGATQVMNWKKGGGTADDPFIYQ